MTDEVLHEGQKCKNKISGTHIPGIAKSLVMPAPSFCLRGTRGMLFDPLSQFFGEESDFIEVVKTDLMEFIRGNLVVKMDHPVPASSSAPETNFIISGSFVKRSRNFRLPVSLISASPHLFSCLPVSPYLRVL